MGFVKISSDLTEWAWFNDNATLAVYTRLLLRASYKERDYKNIHLQRGQLVATIPQIAEQSSLTIQQTRTVLDRLKSTGKITVEKRSKFSIITVVEAALDFQNNSQNNSQTTDSQQAEQHTNNTQTTDKQQANNRQSTDALINNRKIDSKIDREIESEGADSRAREAPGTQQPPKKRYADLVWLTDAEYHDLTDKYGKDMIFWCVQKLNNYKGSTGKNYASDYSAILSWVLDSYREDQEKHKAQTGVKPPGTMPPQSKNPFLDAVLNDNLISGGGK